MRIAGYHNSDIDISKSKDNIELINCGNWLGKIHNIITDTGVKARKDSIFAIGGLYTASKDFFDQQETETKHLAGGQNYGFL